MEMPMKYELIGILLGLAIYNQVLLDIKFPLVIYKKLLDRPIDLEVFYLSIRFLRILKTLTLICTNR